MESKLIAGSFIASLAENMHSKHSLLISASTDPSLEFTSADQKVSGLDWQQQLDSNEVFDFIIADLPLGMERERVKIGETTIKLRKNWLYILRALSHLAPDGMCVALVEPPAFGLAEGPNFLNMLESEGYRLSGVFNAPNNILSSTSIRPVLAILTRDQRSGLFVAELEEEEQARGIAQLFTQGTSADSLTEGIDLTDVIFTGFESLKAKLQLERLETQYKQYQTYALGELAEEINTVRLGETLTHKDNAVYFPMLGSSPVTHDLSELTIKHHNIFQVVLPAHAKSEYVAAFFKSDLGGLILQSLTRGAFIQKLNKSSLQQANVALPEIQEQEEIILSHQRINTLTSAIMKLQKELALNPRNAAAIRLQIDGMLEQVNGLSEAERIMNMAREGESATLEFKVSFCLDTRKGTKEKRIELSSLKTIAAFLNTNGGTLLIGVADNSTVTGVNEEIGKFFKSKDKFMLHFKNCLKASIGEQFYPFIHQRLVDVSGATVLVVVCDPSSTPCYLDGSSFYVRTNPATDQLEGPRLVEYVQNHFSGKNK